MFDCIHIPAAVALSTVMHLTCTAGRWRVVHTTGMKPPPCAAFSFTRIDAQRVLLFGGRQQRQRVNDAYILDLEKWVSKGEF